MNSKYDQIQIEMDQDAESHFVKFRDQAEVERLEDHRLGALWARAFENALKVSGILAVGCAAEESVNALSRPRISLDMAEWATKFVDHCIRRTVYLGTEEIADNKSERAVNKIRNFILRIVSDWDDASWKTDQEYRDQNLSGYVSLSQITRHFQKIEPGVRQAAIVTLVDSGEISPVRSDNNDRTTWYQVAS